MQVRKKKVRLLVLVNDYELNALDNANVKIQRAEKEEWEQLQYDVALQRYTHNELDTGKIELRISGEKGWTNDERTLNLHTGENFVQSTLGPTDMPYYFAAEKQKVFFTSEPDKVILYVRGATCRKKVPKILSRLEFKVGEALFPPDREDKQKLPPDDAEYTLKLSGTQEEQQERIKVLKKSLEEANLHFNFARPMICAGKTVQGLTDELIVRFQPKVTIEEANKLAEEYNFSIERPIRYLGNAFLFRRRDKLDYDLVEIAKELMEKHPVLFAEPNIVFRVEKSVYNPNDFLYPEQPHFQVINADDAWDLLDDINTNLRAGSPDVTIAVFDTEGVDPNHEDLTGNLTDGSSKMTRNFDFVNWGTQTGGNIPGDHGTQCASSATARFDNVVGGVGVAGNCHLIGARIPTALT